MPGKIEGAVVSFLFRERWDFLRRLQLLRARLARRPLVDTTLRAHAGPIEQSPSAPPATLAEAERELSDLDRRAGELDGKASRLTAEIGRAHV